VASAAGWPMRTPRASRTPSCTLPGGLDAMRTGSRAGDLDASPPVLECGAAEVAISALSTKAVTMFLQHTRMGDRAKTLPSAHASSVTSTRPSRSRVPSTMSRLSGSAHQHASGPRVSHFGRLVR
jgi:hypothetical protein